MELRATRDAVVSNGRVGARPGFAAHGRDAEGPSRSQGGEKFQEGLARPDVVLSNRMKTRRLLPDKKPLQAETDRALT